MSETVVSRLAHRVGAAKCRTLTCLLIGFLLLNSVLEGVVLWDNVLWSVFYLAMIFAPWFVRGGKVLLAFTLGMAAVFTGVLMLVFSAADPLRVFRLVVLSSMSGMGSLLAVEVALTGLVVFYSLSPRSGNREPVWGCVLAYLLAGVVFADVYWIASRYWPEAFALNGRIFMPSLGDLLYFSLITLTTCGFGDIVPVQPLIRQLAALEGVLGVLYVAVFIGRQLKFDPHT